MIRLAFRIAASTGNPFSMLISKVTGSPYSHVEGWLSGPATNAKCFSSREPHGAGFSQIDLTAAGWIDLTAAGCWVVTQPIALTGDQEALACGYCLGCDGKNYDGVGLIGFALQNPAIHDYSSIFCSETWASIAQHCWSKILPVQPWQISPGMLFDLAKRWV